MVFPETRDALVRQLFEDEEDNELDKDPFSEKE